jgi:catalase
MLRLILIVVKISNDRGSSSLPTPMCLIKINTSNSKREMKYKISTSYRWVDADGESFLTKMYFIQSIPFTFDELPKIAEDDPEIILEASSNHRYTDEELYNYSVYLMEEEVHPLTFELDLENPELLPVD